MSSNPHFKLLNSSDSLIDYELFNMFSLDNCQNTKLVDYGLLEIQTALPSINFEKIDEYLDFCNESHRFQKLISLPIFKDLIKLADANLIKFDKEFIINWKEKHCLLPSKTIHIYIQQRLFEEKGSTLFQIFKDNYHPSVRTDKWITFVKRLNMIGFKMTDKNADYKIYSLKL